MKKALFLLGFATSLLCFASHTLAADGWASMNGGTTGGAGGTVVTVSTAANLESYAESTSTYIIKVSGTIDLGYSQRINIRSNKTIIGIDTNSTIIGRLDFRDDANNIIIQGLNITNPYSGDPFDGISVGNSAKNIFITHCTIYDCGDGCLDITDQADYVTVSWCKFYYNDPAPYESHRFVNLIGSDDSAYNDRGKLHVTMHHNWWASRCDERMPRVRFGQVHLYNNYYGCPGNGYCAGVGVESQIRVENNYYDDVENPWKNYSDAGIQGIIGWNTGNVFVSTSLPTWAPNDYDNVFVPPYDYTLTDGSDVKNIVMAGAGNVNDINSPTPDPMTWATSPHTVTSTTMTMVATTAFDISGVEYYFECTAGGGHDSGWQASPTYIDTGLTPSTSYTYKVKARDLNLLNLHETDWSAPASASTLRYTCTQPPIADFNEDCQVNFGDFVIFADEWLLPRIPTDFIINGTFDTQLAPWQLVDASGVIGTMTAAFDDSNGLPPGSAYLEADTSSIAVNHHRFYQVFPVDIGGKYMLTGKWSGALVDGTPKNGWAELFVGFIDTNTPSTWGSVMYKKQYKGVGNTGNINFDPNSDGTWDWEDITDSPNTSTPPPEDNIFIADDEYMVVAFNLGGQSSMGVVNVSLDNIKVVECLFTPADLNGDCELNLLDLAAFATEWLNCNRDNPADCWQ